jgi:acid stress-induced BolA-like protein IbaG/YrbA
MNSEQLTQILKEAFPEAEVAVSGKLGNSTFELLMISLMANVRLLVNKPYMHH